MGVVRSFWAGAIRVGRGLDLPELADRVGGFQALVEGGEEALITAGVPPGQARSWCRNPELRTRGDVLTMADDRYPARLQRVPGAPPVLFLEGDPTCLEGPATAVVGTRGCTRYGAQIARRLGGDLAANGMTVVSGLARGIDAHAHRAALERGRTIAVLAHGLGSTAPPSNRWLRRDLVASGGLVVTAWPDDFQAQTYTFPVRNRWVAGLSDRLVVVEAPSKSGALITAGVAAELGRDVWAVPGPLGAPASRGCLALLAQGAQVIEDAGPWVREVCGIASKPRPPWLEALFSGADLDEVARRRAMPVSKLLRELGQLELFGEITRLPGRGYAPGPQASKR